MGTEGDIDRLRLAILADPALHPRLGAIADVEDFAGAAAAMASELGLSVSKETLIPLLVLDLAGIARWMEKPLTPGCPPPGWLPIQVMRAPHFPVEWAWFGDRPLGEPFFENAIREAMMFPLNRFCRFNTPLIDLPAVAQGLPALQPSGFIFHMSRCGSTLVSQMLASDPSRVVLSEAAPFDTLLNLDRMATVPEDLHIALLRAMLGALGQRRAGETRLFVKLDSWHTLRLPLLARAFPDVPWAFLFREPSEVLASQMVERGMQMLPEFTPPEVYGLTPDDASLPADEYCARVLARTCAAVLERDGGLLVNYCELPEAAWTRILPHFGIASSDAQRTAMQVVSHSDAKSPGVPFSPLQAKRGIMTEALVAVAERQLGAIYAALEARRLGQG
jgi:hypothetical protein